MNILNPGCANGRSKCLEGAPGYLGYLQPEPITVEVPWNQQEPKQFLQKPVDWWNSWEITQFEFPSKTKKRLQGS